MQYQQADNWRKFASHCLTVPYHRALPALVQMYQVIDYRFNELPISRFILLHTDGYWMRCSLNGPIAWIFMYERSFCGGIDSDWMCWPIQGAYWSFGSHEETMLVTVKKETLQNFGFKCEAEEWREQIFNNNEKVIKSDKGEVPQFNNHFNSLR